MIIVFNWRLCSLKALFHEKTKLIDDLVDNYPNIIIIIIISLFMYLQMTNLNQLQLKTSIYNSLFLYKAYWDQIHITQPRQEMI